MRNVRASRRWVIAAVLLLGAVGLSALINRVGNDDTAEGGSEVEQVESAKPAKPIKVTPTKQGAVSAAVRLAAAPQWWLYLTDHDIRAEVHRVASERSADRLADEMVSRIGAARDRLMDAKGGIWWVVRPLAWRIDSYRASSTTVSVWIVNVLSAGSVAIPQADWRTATLDLVWDGYRWMLDEERSVAGPTPATGPSDDPWNAEPFDDALDGFTRLGPEVD